jgi:type IV pilus assembly protein PilV
MNRSIRPLGFQRGSRQRGISLIEVLVGLLLFSFGILGLVGLQASMTQGQTVSKTRTDASYLANELIGIMWSDITHIGSYTTAGCDSYARCADWKAKLAAQLPRGDLVELTPDVGTGATAGDVLITIKWTMPDGSEHKYTTTTTVRAKS